MRFLCQRTPKINRFTDEYSILCQICCRTLNPLKYPFLTEEVREQLWNDNFDPSSLFFLPPFLLFLHAALGHGVDFLDRNLSCRGLGGWTWASPWTMVMDGEIEGGQNSLDSGRRRLSPASRSGATANTRPSTPVGGPQSRKEIAYHGFRMRWRPAEQSGGGGTVMAGAEQKGQHLTAHDGRSRPHGRPSWRRQGHRRRV
jgi:hypothetical protein